MARHALAFSADFDLLVKERTCERTELLKELVARLKAATGKESREEFCELFRHAKTVLELNESQLSDMFDVSRPTISRWESGEFAPHQLGRKPLFDQLAKVAQQRLRAIR